jgi:hypothetical protein
MTSGSHPSLPMYQLTVGGGGRVVPPPHAASGTVNRAAVSSAFPRIPTSSSVNAIPLITGPDAPYCPVLDVASVSTAIVIRSAWKATEE